jgi:hypothetical protein
MLEMQLTKNRFEEIQAQDVQIPAQETTAKGSKGSGVYNESEHKSCVQDQDAKVRCSVFETRCS